MTTTYGVQARTVNTFRDRSTWAAGPWDDEPDHVQWTDPDTGLPCLIHRNQFGSWCGYVGVAEGHPWFARGYGELDDAPQVHGGLTYADFCMDDAPEGEGICHVPEPGQPDRVWWLGFDTGHAFDLVPMMQSYAFHDATYRTADYVIAECRSLARQAQDAADA